MSAASNRVFSYKSDCFRDFKTPSYREVSPLFLERCPYGHIDHVEASIIFIGSLHMIAVIGRPPH